MTLYGVRADERTDRHTPSLGAVSQEVVPSRPEVTAGEVFVLLLATAATATGTWSLALAQVGSHNGWLALSLGVATAAAIAATVYALGRPHLRLDRREPIGLAGIAVVAMFMFFPGFPYAYGDKDPGVYVAHGFAIEREGGIAIPDEAISQGLRPPNVASSRFPGLWPTGDGAAFASQFYHWYPSFLATAVDVGGESAPFQLNPLLGTVSVMLLALAARRAAARALDRAAGDIAGVLTATLLLTSMIQVWQTKYPSTETAAQLLVSAALLSLVLATAQRWSGAAFLAGLLVTSSFLVRPDGFLYIMMGVAVLAGLFATRRLDARAEAFGLGLLPLLPYASWNAYVEREDYTTSISTPSLPLLVAITLGAAAAAMLIRRLLSPTQGWWDSYTARAARPWPLQRLTGMILTALIGITLLGFRYRDKLLGADHKHFGPVGDTAPSLNELNLIRLSWFVTYPGLMLMVAGCAVILLRRWQAPLFALVGPGLALLPLYLWDARVSPQLMWWVRRFIPAVLPAVLILIALALAWALTRNSRAVRTGGAALAAMLVVIYASQSLPIKDHREMGGSWSLARDVAHSAGDEQGVFLFVYPTDERDAARNIPGPVWFIHGHLSAPLQPDGARIDEVESYQNAFPDRPVFLVAGPAGLPESLPDDRFVHVKDITQEVEVWEEAHVHRPARAESFEHTLSIYRYR